MELMNYGKIGSLVQDLKFA